MGTGSLRFGDLPIHSGGAAMDAAPFDLLTVSFATRATRRASFALFAACGSLVSGIENEAVAAKRRKKSKSMNKKGKNGNAGTERCLRLDSACVRGEKTRCC